MFTTEPTVSNSNVAAHHDIIHKRGDTLVRKFRFWTDAAKTVAEPITTSIFRMDVVSKNGTPLIFSFSIGDALSFTAPNILNLNMAAVLMRVPSGDYEYDLEQTLSDTVTVITRFEGDFIIVKDVTPVT